MLRRGSLVVKNSHTSIYNIEPPKWLYYLGNLAVKLGVECYFDNS
jgi:hypothetical protein